MLRDADDQVTDPTTDESHAQPMSMMDPLIAPLTDARLTEPGLPEVMRRQAIGTVRLQEAVADPAKTSSTTDIVAEGSYYDMQTLDRHLLRLVLDRSVTIADAMLVSSNSHDFSVMLKRAGLDHAQVDLPDRLR